MDMAAKTALRTKGFTLIEMLIAISVVGISVAGVLLAFQTASRNSAEPVVQQQLISLAQSLTEEAMLQPYTPAANASPVGCARDTFNDVSDFNGYATSGYVCAPDGSAIASLNGYSVSISVAPATVAGVAMKKVSVQVSKGSNSYLLTTYRGDLS